MPNALMVIVPYRHAGTWVFDDESVGLRREPFVLGVPEMIDDLVREIPGSGKRFRLIFSVQPFPGYQRELEWVRADMGGNWYRTADPPMEGWLCPALYKYFDRAPERLYLRAEALTEGLGAAVPRWWEFWRWGRRNP